MASGRIGKSRSLMKIRSEAARQGDAGEVGQDVAGRPPRGAISQPASGSWI